MTATKTPPIPLPKFTTAEEAKKAGYFQLTTPAEIPGEANTLREILANFAGSNIEVCTVGTQHSRTVWRKGRRANLGCEYSGATSRRLREMFEA